MKTTEELLREATPLKSWKVNMHLVTGRPKKQAGGVAGVPYADSEIVASIGDNSHGSYRHYSKETADANRELIVRMAHSFEAMREFAQAIESGYYTASKHAKQRARQVLAIAEVQS